MHTKFQANDRVMDQHGNIGTVAFAYAGATVGRGSRLECEQSLYEVIFDNQSLALRFDRELSRAS
jgi:hypothetical protein